jgi:transposase
MRGSDMRTGELFSYVDLEERVPRNHPLRLIRRVINEVLTTLDREFAGLYAAEGRPSIAPERLLRALLLQAFYTIRSERQLMEQLHYNLLYRWFVGLGVDDPVWVPTVFTTNRDRLLDAEVARKFLAELLGHKEVCALLSDEHFSVDGTQIAAWASMKSFVAKDGSGEPPSPGRNGERDFHGERRSNETHASTTDPEAKLSKKGKGKEAKLAYTGNVMTRTAMASSSKQNCDRRPAWSSARPRRTWSCAIRRAPSASRWAPTKASIRSISWLTCGTST